MMGASVDHALVQFKTLARRIFHSDPRPKAPWRCVWDLIQNLLMDSRYDPTTVQTTLQDVYGSHRRLLGSPGPSLPSLRIGLTTSDITDGQLCLFTNYRGTGRPEQPSAYRVLTPPSGQPEPYVCDV
jgi:hypothetical protein